MNQKIYSHQGGENQSGDFRHKNIQCMEKQTVIHIL